MTDTLNTEQAAISIAFKAVQLYAESHPRPVQVTQGQAAEMLGLSRHTIGRMLRTGVLKLNKCGLISVGEIDALLKPSSH